jgi:hypothetical protein
MKRIILFLFLFFEIVGSHAQERDTAKPVYNIDTLAKQGAVFVMDGVVLQKPYHFNPDGIIDINIIIHDKAKEWFEGDAQNGLVVMISRRRAIAEYQKKFSALSKGYKAFLDSYDERFSRADKAYKKYVDTHEANEKDLFYVLNGKLLESGERETIQRLYKIPVESIKKIRFVKNGVKSYEGDRSFLIITTRQ